MAGISARGTKKFGFLIETLAAAAAATAVAAAAAAAAFCNRLNINYSHVRLSLGSSLSEKNQCIRAKNGNTEHTKGNKIVPGKSGYKIYRG